MRLSVSFRILRCRSGSRVATRAARNACEAIHSRQSSVAFKQEYSSFCGSSGSGLVGRGSCRAVFPIHVPIRHPRLGRSLALPASPYQPRPTSLALSEAVYAASCVRPSWGRRSIRQGHRVRPGRRRWDGNLARWPATRVSDGNHGDRHPQTSGRR